jgi:hypothetical protein
MEIIPVRFLNIWQKPDVLNFLIKIFRKKIYDPDLSLGHSSYQSETGNIKSHHGDMIRV